MNEHRILGERTGSVHGPLLVVFAQIHGNEPAGYLAIRELFEAIDEEYIKRHYFDFRGKILALRGNVKASERGVRFIDKDLNRSWTPENVKRITEATDDRLLDAEDIEIRENLEVIHHYLETYKPSRLVVLDLHTTTATGGIFTIPAPDEEARRIALSLQTPVLHGFLDGLRGTTLHYFSNKHYPGIHVTSIAFEAGQHESPEAPKNAASAIINCFKTIGGFYEEDIEIRHDLLLQEKSKGLPREAKLMYVHRIEPEDEFRMRRDKRYRNFDPIERGELLAFDKDGEIRAPYGGYILMPLYQQQGDDGFFILQEITPKAPAVLKSNSDLATSK